MFLGTQLALDHLNDYLQPRAVIQHVLEAQNRFVVKNEVFLWLPKALGGRGQYTVSWSLWMQVDIIILILANLFTLCSEVCNFFTFL